LSGLSELSSGPETLQPVMDALAQARDTLGQLVPPTDSDYKENKSIIAYPNPHTVWDQITIPETVRNTRGIISFFQQQHNLRLSSWFVRSAAGEGRKLYPVDEPVRPELLPKFDLPSVKATMEIMSNKQIREKQKYISKWKELVAGGPEAIAAFVASPVATLDVDLPLQDLLFQRAGLDLSKRRRVQFDDMTLVNEDGEVVETAKIVLNVQ
jgi:hypothetical protein